MFTTVAVCSLLAFAVAMCYELFPLDYTSSIRAEAETDGVDKYLVAALVKAESNFDPGADSSAGAKGLMQLKDETASFCASQLGLTLSDGDIYSPEINIKLGTYYLKRMLDIFGGDVALAVAAYNAGEGNVRKWLSDPSYSADGVTLDTIPFSETESHVRKISFYQRIYRILYPNL